MADTKRTSTDLLTNLFQDGQAAASITPADVRDLIVSMISPFGSLAMTTPAATTITVPGTYYKAAGTTTISTTTESVTDGSVNNRLVYTGTPDRHFQVVVALSMTCASSNQVLGMKIAKNGTVIDESIIRRKVGTGSDVGAAALIADVSLSTNDYVELFVTNETTTGAVTIDEVCMSIHGLFV